MENEKTLAQLAYEQNFKDFESKYIELIKSKVKKDDELMGLIRENDKLQRLIDILGEN